MREEEVCETFFPHQPEQAELLPRHVRDELPAGHLCFAIHEVVEERDLSAFYREYSDQAMTAFKRNVELYPRSANVYDSLADGLEAAGQPELALQNVQNAVEVATQAGDPLLPDFKKHLERLTAAGKTAPGKAGQAK